MNLFDTGALAFIGGSVRAAIVRAFLILFLGGSISIVIYNPPSTEAAEPPYDCKTCHALLYKTSVAQPFQHGDLILEEKCDICHIKTESKGRWGSRGKHGYGLFSRLESGITVCKVCHSFGISHPVNVKAEGVDVKTPETLPTVDEVITCITCHFPHGGPRKYLVRLDEQRELCIQCHIAPKFVSAITVCDPDAVWVRRPIGPRTTDEGFFTIQTNAEEKQ